MDLVRYWLEGTNEFHDAMMTFLLIFLRISINIRHFRWHETKVNERKINRGRRLSIEKN